MNVRRPVAASASAAVLAGALVGLAPTSASAAYAPVAQYAGGVMEACRTQVDGARAVEFRVDATEGRRNHLTATIYRSREERPGSTTRAFRSQAPRGEVSDPTTVPLRRGDTMEAFVAFVEHQGRHVELSRGDLPRCTS